MLSFLYHTHMKGICGPCLVPSKTGLSNTKIGLAVIIVAKYGNGFNFFFWWSLWNRLELYWWLVHQLWESMNRATSTYYLIARCFLRMDGAIYVFHSPACMSLRFELFLQVLWHIILNHLFNIMNISGLQFFFLLVRALLWVLLFPNLWFHSKLFHNL